MPKKTTPLQRVEGTERYILLTGENRKKQQQEIEGERENLDFAKWKQKKANHVTGKPEK